MGHVRHRASGARRPSFSPRASSSASGSTGRLRVERLERRPNLLGHLPGGMLLSFERPSPAPWPPCRGTPAIRPISAALENYTVATQPRSDSLRGCIT
jgi:hypothetical protein